MKNELRIGSLLKVKYTDSENKEHEAVTRVIGVHEDEVLGDGWNVEVEAVSEDFHECTSEPVELTGEILLKSGFKNETMYIIKNLYLIEYGDFYFVLDNLNGYYHVKLSNHGFGHEKQVGLGVIKYLHQLQNLFFSITGKELEINL